MSVDAHLHQWSYPAALITVPEDDKYNSCQQRQNNVTYFLFIRFLLFNKYDLCAHSSCRWWLLF